MPTADPPAQHPADRPPVDRPSAADRPLYAWEKAAVLLLLLIAVAFGWLTLMRSAYLKTRMTDFGVYARAAWAVRTGGDLYRTVDDNGWHYVYPPPFVLLFLPLADPPAGTDRSGYLPYPAGVVVWYAVSLLLLGYALHTFAAVCLPGAVPWSRRWWYARLLPFDICIGGIGYTLARGQANILLVAILAAAFAAAVRSRPIRSGAWFAAAACLKVFPGLLVLFPIVRREWRAAIGYVGGAAVLLLVLPALVWGPTGAIRENVRFLQLVVAPGLIDGRDLPEEDRLLAAELHNMTAKDSQSFVATLHYWRYPDHANRPHHPDPDARRWHLILSAATVLLTVVAGERLRRRARASALTPGPSPSETVPKRDGGRGETEPSDISVDGLSSDPLPPSTELTVSEGEGGERSEPGEGSNFAPSPAEWLVFLGCLVAVMLLAVPVSHFHYYAIMVPFVAGLVCRGIERNPGRALPDAVTLTAVTAWGLGTGLPLFDGPFAPLRNAGVAPVATFGLWAFGVGSLLFSRPAVGVLPPSARTVAAG